MTEDIKYTQTITTRVTLEIEKAMAVYIARKKKEFPRYNEADLIRSAIVDFLKKKGELEHNKDYL